MSLAEKREGRGLWIVQHTVLGVVRPSVMLAHLPGGLALPGWLPW